MKLLAAGIVLVLAASTGADAFPIFHKARTTDKLPKPIDTPIVRPKIREDHKVMKRAGRHPSQFQHAEYGNEWDKILKIAPRHDFPDYIMRSGLE
jgi:hypothetical protein